MILIHRLRSKTKLADALIICLLLFENTLTGQPLEPRAIIDKMQSQLGKITDYAVIAKTVVDIPNLRMPNKTITVFYKRPDKFSVKTSGFAIVPKVGFMPSVTDLIKDNVDITLRNTLIENKQTIYVLEITPREEKFNIATTLWINANRWTLEKVLISAKDFGESVINFNYVKINGFWLPDTTTVFLNMKRGIPDMQRPSVEYPVGFMPYDNKPKDITGKVTISFHGYKVNQGIDDSVFDN